MTLWQAARQRLEATRDAALLLLAPQACRQCGGQAERVADGAVCRACWQDWFREQARRAQVCARCGRWADAEGTSVARRERCEQCSAWALEWLRSGGAYVGALRAALLAFKRIPLMPEPLRRMLHETWRQEAALHASDLIAPIPLAPRRERQRGYNQAALLAREVAGVARLPVVTEALARVIETHPHRAGHDERARRDALKGAFRVARPRLIAGRRVLLVDDTLTSGATLDCAAQALLAAGATAVSALTAARAILRARAGAV
ncbi:MAG: phosphoribosyltransferase [Chloracidobacterium sp. CP2_5A]|nr:MAG: phosphoribosyltransferase [Chloracidobacterium sp. CP2_5A]